MRKLTNTLLFGITLGLIFSYFSPFLSYGDPCYLCFLQRICLFGIFAGILITNRFEGEKKGSWLALLFSVLGGSVAALQLSYFFENQPKPAFASILDFPLFFWSFFLFSILFILLIPFLIQKQKPKVAPFHPIIKGCVFIVLILALGNVITYIRIKLQHGL